jgi:hypothetical protein
MIQYQKNGQPCQICVKVEVKQLHVELMIMKLLCLVVIIEKEEQWIQLKNML